MIRSIIKNYPGYSINDLLDTDYRTVNKVFFVTPEQEKEEAPQKVMDLGSFIKSL